MQITMKTTVFDRVVEALSDFAISFANARLAAEEIERLHKMSDEELALHNVAPKIRHQRFVFESLTDSAT